MDQSSNMPPSAKWGLGLFGAMAVGVTAGTALKSAIWVFLAVLAATGALLGGGLYLWRAWQRKKRSAQLGGQLHQHASSAPRAMSDPGHRARLDDLRIKFEQGIQKYRALGKDLYKLPWFVIVGAPGSGKTEAIRHCNVGFPPGMQDFLQGVGGTINMNWWFTNQAVILDTAGRLIFEEAPPGQTSEWREFLNLLKKNRGNCPINGLLLTIAVDSLVKDSADEISSKAGRIAQQLDVIQRVLDVRFPVFVLVTKCDLLTGFREFFEGMTDPNLQHQMLGWSNHAPLDAAFDPKKVDDHLEEVGRRLRRRRLGLLRDPVADPANAGQRRTDEVDSLFALPRSLAGIGSRLRLYLETIFVAGEWSSKPLFLRGIYFASSLREGAALDQDLARAIGAPVDQLPPGRSWEKERAFFLRDLFLEKIFPERGLVTRATSAARLLQRRQVALYGGGFAALAGFCLLSWFGMASFRAGIGDQAPYWEAAAADPGFQRRVVEEQGGVPVYLGSKPAGEPLGDSVTFVDFQAALHRYAKEPLKLGVFKGIGSLVGLEGDRREAQKVIFERSVVKPLAEAARKKLAAGEGVVSPETLQRQGAALLTLLRVEAGIAEKQGRTLSEGEARDFLTSLLDYATGQEQPRASVDRLAAVLRGTYEGSWPPSWLSGGGNFETNHALALGLQSHLQGLQAKLEAADAGLAQLRMLRSQLLDARALEEQLLRSERPEERLLRDVIEKAGQASRTLAGVKQLGLGGAEPFSLRAGYEAAAAAGFAGLTNELRPFYAAMDRGPRLQAAVAQGLGVEVPEPVLFRQVRQLFANAGEGVRGKQTSLPPNELEQLKELDRAYVASAGGATQFESRMRGYEEAANLLKVSAQQPFRGVALVRQKWAPFQPWLANVQQAKAAAAGYAGEYRAAYEKVCVYFLDVALRNAAGQLLAEYSGQVRAGLAPRMRFPLVRQGTPGGSELTPEELGKAAEYLEDVRQDLEAAALAAVKPLAPGSPLENFGKVIASLREVAAGLVTTNGTLATATIGLAKPHTPPRSEDDWRGSFRLASINKDNPEQAKRTETEGELARLPADAGFTIHLFRQYSSRAPDRKLQVGAWGALRLLLDPGAMAGEGGKPWRILLPPINSWGPADAGIRDGRVALTIDFDRPLPHPNRWPARDSIERLGVQ